MTKKREWRLAGFAAFLCTAAIVVSGAQAQDNNYKVGGTQCWINGTLVGGFPPGYNCPSQGGGGGGNRPSNADVRAANIAFKNYASSYNRALKLYNQGISANAVQGLSLCQSALSSIDTALQYEPGDGNAQNLRREITSCISAANGKYAVQHGDFDRGISYYREAESEYPESNALWEQSIAWAESVRRQGVAAQAYSRYIDAYHRAQNLYNSAISLDAAHALPLCQSALSIIDEALQNLPGDGPALTMRRQITACISNCNGILSVQRGDFDRGISYYREAESEYPESNDLWEKRIAWAESMRRQANAKQQSTANTNVTAATNPEQERKDQVFALFTRGNELYESKDYKGAEALSRQWIALEPRSPQAYYGLGLDLMYQERYAEAEAAYRQAAQLNPNDPQYEQELGYVLKAQNRFEEAEAAFRKGLELWPGNTELQQALQGTISQHALYDRQNKPKQTTTGGESLKDALNSGSGSGSTDAGNSSPTQKALDETNSNRVATQQGLPGTDENAKDSGGMVFNTAGDKNSAPPVDLSGVGRGPADAALLSHIPQNDKVKNDKSIANSVAYYSKLEAANAVKKQRIADLQKQIDGKQGDPAILKAQQGQVANEVKVNEGYQQQAVQSIKKELENLDVPWIEQPETPAKPDGKDKEKQP